MKNRITVRRFTALALYFSCFAAYGNSQELATIEHAVVEYIERHHPPEATLNIVLQRLDKRLKLALCEEDLELSWSPGSRQIGRTTVSVSCTAPKPWRIFVRATVEKESLTWVLNSAVRKGDKLTRQLVSQESVMLGNGGQFGLPQGQPIKDIEPWLGQVFVRAIQAGRILGDAALQLPYVVTKGDSVSIIYKTSQLAIKAKGVALESGALQEKISVKNSVSDKVIDAIVIGRSNVAISR